jgi:hypothetical protein
MISAFFSSAGRLVRAAIVLGTLVSTLALMVMGAKVSGWFVDAQQAARAAQLDEREATIKAAEKAAQDKRESDLNKREADLAAKVSEARTELERVKAETVRAKEEANKAARRLAALEAPTQSRHWFAHFTFSKPYEAPMVVDTNGSKQECESKIEDVMRTTRIDRASKGLPTDGVAHWCALEDVEVTPMTKVAEGRP